MKKCVICKKIKSLSDFHKNKNVKDGHAVQCKECNNNYIKHRYHTDKVFRQYLVTYGKNRYKKLKTDPVEEEKRKAIHKQCSKKYYDNNLDKVKKWKTTQKYLKISGIHKKLWDRANQHCESCGTPIKKIASGYATHHLNENLNDNRLENLLILCTRCHLHKFHKPYSKKSKT